MSYKRRETMDTIKELKSKIKVVNEFISFYIIKCAEE